MSVTGSHPAPPPDGPTGPSNGAAAPAWGDPAPPAPAGPAPAVSVVMTVYNTAPYVGEAIDSILKQTFADFEFIIVDDGSTDGCPDLLRRYADQDPRVRFVARPHRGIVPAVCDGIDLARGRYLARMDSDDVAVPHRFERQVAYLDAHPECVIVGSRVMLMDPYGSPVTPTGQKLVHDEIDAELLTEGGGWAMVHPSVMMRTAALRQVGGYRGQVNMSEDHDLYLRLAEVGRVANLPDVLLWYRRHYKSTSHTEYRQMWAVKEQILREAHERRGMKLPAGRTLTRWEPMALPQQLRLWGWAAIKAGNLSVARKHAVGAVKAAPLSLEAWRLMYCALRGH